MGVKRKEKEGKKENRESDYEVVVMDMDGTLYELDGTDKGFDGSSLQRQVLSKLREYVMEQEEIEKEKIDELLALAKRQGGYSEFFSKRYGMTRAEYFDRVWDIDPEGIVISGGVGAVAVKKFRQKSQFLILVTQAPRVWQRRVMDYLGLEGMFDEVYTGEQFGRKEEILEELANRYVGRTIVSVGDQWETDIRPAVELGWKAVLVAGPEELSKIIEG